VANDVWGVGRQDVAGGASTSLTSMTHVPIRASAVQLGGSVAVITSSDATTVTISGSGVQLKGNDTNGVKFYENGTEYLKFTMNGGYSAQITATESAYPSLYLSGSSVHLDSSDGLTWFGAYGSERLAVDHSDSTKPQLVARFPSGQSVNLVISGSGVKIGSNVGTTTFSKGTADYLNHTYDGVNDVTVSAQTYNVNFGSQGFAALSGSTVALNSTNAVALQKDGTSYISISNNGTNTTLSASNSIYVTPGPAGSLFVTGSVVSPRLTGSLTRLVDGSPYLLAGPNITIATSSNGSIQITGSAGAAAGSNTQIQYNDGGSFGGDAEFTYNKTANLLTLTGSITHGDRNTSSGNYSHSQGEVTTASGNYSHSEGSQTTASGGSSHAEGYQTTASGNNSHAEGGMTLASNSLAHAEGQYTIAAGSAAHAEGYSTEANAWYSHAEGLDAIASGDYSHAEGELTKTLGRSSHSEGYLTIASGSYSHAAGIGTITSGSGQNVVGNYNKRNNNTSLFIIGDGTGDTDAQRSDIVRVNSGSTIGTGRVEITGSLVATLGISGSLTTLANGSPYLLAGPNITINTGSNGRIEITGSAGGGGGSSGPFTEASNVAAYTTSSIAIGLGGAASTRGSDISFFVSGSIGSAPSRATSGLSLFGGDVATSGSIHLVTGSYQTAISLIGTATSASLEVRNMTLGGGVIHSVKTSTNNTVNFLEVLPNGSQENTKIAVMRTAYAGSTAINPYKTTDTNFFVGGIAGSKNGSSGGTSVFGGDLVISGSAYLGSTSTDNLVLNGRLTSDIIPSSDRVYNLGSSTYRFANVYTGDLHLRNERGDYTLIEEEDCLTIRFNKTGKRYKFVLEAVPQYDEDPIVR
jgi:hypothetical protein